MKIGLGTPHSLLIALQFLDLNIMCCEDWSRNSTKFLNGYAAIGPDNVL